MYELVVVDLRDPVREGALRVNVSRRQHPSAALWARSLGNPFTVARTEPWGAASARFRSWLWTRLQADASQEADALDRIAGLADADSGSVVELGCWCRGADTCHAHVVASAVRWFASTKEV